jgi:hypothetical protein
MQIDPTNKHCVAVMGDGIVILNPPRTLGKREALVFAAWIVALVCDDELWSETLFAVTNS